MALAGCAKHDQTSQTTTTTTDTSTTAPADVTSSAAPGTAATSTAAPGEATTAPAAATTVPAGEAAPAATSAAAANGSTGTFTFIDLPLYPGAVEDKTQKMSVSGNGGSVEIDVYTTKDDTKKVADWYKNHLPADWQNSVMTVNDKTVGTFSHEQSGVGDQSVIVGDNNGTTRIQLATKHGK